MVFDLSAEDLGGRFVGELHNGGHALDEHPCLEQVFVEFLAVELDAGLLELMTNFEDKLVLRN